jgi:hypothetical protein
MIQRITFVFMLTYLWVTMILLGSIVLETFIVYPNIFHNPPGSVATAALRGAVQRAPDVNAVRARARLSRASSRA